jgi:hypothetical protein
LIGLTLTMVPLLLDEGRELMGAFYAVAFPRHCRRQFAVALLMVSACIPEYQGWAGIAGWKPGSLVTTLFAPRIAQQHGWQAPA